ncbi:MULTISPECIES: amino acid ABC transporter permease [Paraburkholderia]|jgi:polar amino acid transport system permease protein|uniref:Amino acid ABC transporter permease n=1 Tax=Paraburkholderia hospita TaxID=169430 RepID=A0AAJ4WSC4_9BURK|nr:amino acid ABC transporter permease [Paraburkholderia hospita]EUC19425.1 polar amino acid ABC transporter, inner membrane subunit [Burkholderia sp. BT03]SKC91820.1 amino acid ABC transporter membrane protein 1, PAAT family [Burkholderia sp. CF099]SOE86690.1 amino acid ABC transporter membrane protein 1, PAAT family [Burkholderia sp. YR290]AUT71827.1 amino acid ABC transporter permease [Paraburkholderia hospita]AXF02777.1 amino acid ABC transporter permease [Paraburkholderia hospita]
MSYTFDFSSFDMYAGMLVSGVGVTLGLTAVSTVLGGLVGIGGAVVASSGPKWARGLIAAYVEVIRNTPFLVQLFFVFFGLPSLGIHIDEIQAAIFAMTVNLGAYAIEIVRAGIDSIPRGQIQAAQALGLQQRQVFRHVVLPQAVANVFPALLSQVLIVMLGSAVVSQISVPDLTYAANYIQSRNFRSFEAYLIITATYLVLSVVLRQVLNRLGKGLFAGRAARSSDAPRGLLRTLFAIRGARTASTTERSS